MNNKYWSELTDELKNATKEKGHPFKFCTLATIGNERLPRLRTVVLRHFTDDHGLIFYTDKRSKKILHIKENNMVSLLFYHPQLQLQVKIEGKAYIINEGDAVSKYWKGIHEGGKRDYTTHKAPGSTINEPEQIEYLSDNNFFCPVEIEPFKIEYLKLAQPHHLRIRFSKEKGKWSKEYLVP